MKYNFSEKNLGSDFCKHTVDEVRVAIQKGRSSTILGMPLSGMITLCRYLTTTDMAFFAYLDTQSVKYTRNDLFIALYNELEGKDLHDVSINSFEACKKQLRKLLLSQKRIVILIARVDSLQEELSSGLLADFKTLADIDLGKIIIIGTSRQPFNKLSATALNHNPSFMTDAIYFTPYKGRDFEKLVKFLPGSIHISPKAIETIQTLSGGHICLMWQLLKTDYFDNPLQDEILQLHLQTIYEAYLPNQQSQLRRIATGKAIKDLDPFLLKIGLVKEVNGNYELFTPLLRDYILQYVSTKLPKKERKLFALLKKKKGKLVTKEEIFKDLWGEDALQATDWALNAVIYRLKKNQMFINKGYIIENEKGEGYRMVKG